MRLTTQADFKQANVKQMNVRQATRRAQASVDLRLRQTLCELNYVRLSRLLPGLREGAKAWLLKDGAEASIAWLGEPIFEPLEITLLDSARFTSTIALNLRLVTGVAPKISVRLYHDADLAEVLTWDGHRPWRATYSYPNRHMYQRDEKLCLNLFLSDWLDFCDNRGVFSHVNCDRHHI